MRVKDIQVGQAYCWKPSGSVFIVTRIDRLHFPHEHNMICAYWRRAGEGSSTFHVYPKDVVPI